MSHITDVLVITAGSEGGEAIAHVNGWLAGLDSCRPQLAVIGTEEAGGCKAFSMRVWAAAVNYLDAEGLAEVIAGAPWKIPSSVMAYFDSESGVTFAMSPARPERLEISR